MPWSRCSLTMQTRDHKVLLNDTPFGTLWITVREFGIIITEPSELYNSEII